MKNNKLRSISKLLALVVIALSITSCYEDFVENEFDFTSVYLPKETIDRTFIMGEGMQIGVGVVLGGRLDNTEDVEVTFSLDESLLDPGSALPESYYELVDSEGNPANNKIIIPAGKTQGFVYVKADSIKFLNDPVSLGNNYALGFTLDNVVKADSILANLKSTKITFTYINQLYGNYIQKGQFIKTALDDPSTTEDESGAPETIVYPGAVSDVLEFTMVSPNSLVNDGIADLKGSDKKLNIILADDNSISIETATGGVTIVDDGSSSYNPETREIKLNYSFEFNFFKYEVTEVLEFRNREVDGVNQYTF
ncbi:MAG: DUF1735 domain-containing protein [Polaribacter sp.]|uniref:DUF1735 domain-containing protein n=1 Tax=Polaribacter sp. TaxID=1920175 RepID=UPI00326713C6